MFKLDSKYHSVDQIALGVAGQIAALKTRLPRELAFAALFAPPRQDTSGFGVSIGWEAKIWPNSDSEPIAECDAEGEAFGLAVDPLDGGLVHGNDHCSLVCSEFRHPARMDCGPLRSFAISPDGKSFVLGHEWLTYRRKNWPLQLVSFARKKVRKRWQVAENMVRESDGFTFSHLAYTWDGKHLVAIEWSKRKSGAEYVRGNQPSLRVFDAKTLEPVASAKFKAPADALVLCGRQIVAKSGNLLKVWESPELAGKPIDVDLADVASAVAGDPHGRFVLTATGTTVSVWDTKSWTVAKTYDWKSGPITCLAVAPDGLTAAAGTATGKVVVWDVE